MTWSTFISILIGWILTLGDIIPNPSYAPSYVPGIITSDQLWWLGLAECSSMHGVCTTREASAHLPPGPRAPARVSLPSQPLDEPKRGPDPEPLRPSDTLFGKRGGLEATTMGVHSSTSQLNLSRSFVSLKSPNVSLKKCSRQAENRTSVNPWPLPPP